MSFWDNVFAGPQQAPQRQGISPPLTVGRAWWQDDPVGTLVREAHGHGDTPPAGGYGLTDQEIAAVRKRGHGQINAEQAEQIAEYDLAHKAKYQAVCDQCGSGNFILAGTRIAGVIMPSNKCFNCGNMARSPEPAVGGGSGAGSIHTRQIDTGGANGQSMFMRFNGVPRGYAPRS